MISIITPTYQRGDKLCRLYESLLRQTCKEFEWIVIDDGSTDGTDKVCKKLLEDKKIKMVYQHTENNGKCIAVNFAVKFASADYILIVDSDDWLKDDAVEIIEARLSYFDEDICALSFFREYSDGRINGNFFEKDAFKANYIDVRVNSNDGWNDKSEVYRKDILLKFPFPQYGKERFLAENIVWIPMSYEYDMYFFNQSIYVGEYLDGGLTKNVFRNKRNNPVGAYKVAELYMGSHMNQINKIKGSILYTYYSKIALKSYFKSFVETKHKFLYITTFIPALIYGGILKKKEKLIVDVGK
ncbi:MAG: glycosyltransferase family 2 protein [Lachnospiraceae bacterium]|nr:glycosyltransferase family 2 protein [Lachnospiraceae bacterium]